MLETPKSKNHKLIFFFKIDKHIFKNHSYETYKKDKNEYETCK